VVKLRDIAKIFAGASALAPDDAEAAPMYFRSRGKNIFGLKNPTRQEAESFTKEYGGARALHGENTYVWPLNPAHEVAEEALDTYGSHRLIFKNPGELKFMQENIPNLFKAGVGAAGLGASIYSPEQAQARQYRDMAESEALQESYLDPADMIAAAATGGGSLTLKAAQALADPVIKYGVDAVDEFFKKRNEGDQEFEGEYQW